MSLSAKADAGCVLCGRKKTERNHVGGRNHVAWFTMQFCIKHHTQFHDLLRNAGMDLTYTPDPQERLLRALQACLVAQWMFTDALRKRNSDETN